MDSGVAVQTAQADPKLTQEQVQSISQGIYIKHLSMKDANTGEIFMDDPNWDDGPSQQIGEGAAMREVHFPWKMLQSNAIARMMVFCSKEKIEKMTMD